LNRNVNLLCGIVAVALLPALGVGCRRSPVAAVKKPATPLPQVSHKGSPANDSRPVTTALATFKPSPLLYESYPDKTEMIALTFDAGSDDDGAPLLLKTLVERHLHVTVFLTGKFCEQHPKTCRAIADAGMEIGNHSYSHPYFTRITREAILKQLARGEATITKACGRGAKPLFRFPYGDCDRRTRAIVAAAGYQAVGWSLDSLDSVGKHKSADFIVNRFLHKLKPGYITLMHVESVDTARSLPRILDYLDRQHLRVVPVSQLLLASADAEALKQLKARQRGKTKSHGKMQAANAAPASGSM
jgi:peptidoglycan/xylan/chitin deacetylase (PgdA/CDA1 family)